MSNIIKFKKKRVSHGIILSGTQCTNEYGPVSKEIHLNDLMFYALYWDKITITQIPGFHFGNSNFKEFEHNGVVESFVNTIPLQGVHSSQMQKLALESLIACQSIKKQDKDTEWLIYNNVKTSLNSSKSKELLERDTLRVKIAECLPYPTAYVALDKMLRFKEEKLSELDELHYAKYKLFEQISQYDDPDRRGLAEIFEINEFSRRLESYQEQFAEFCPNYGLKPLISDIKSNKPNLWESAFVAGDMLLSGGISLSGSFTIGKNLFTTILGHKQKIHQANQNSPEFQYISSAVNSGILLPRIRV